MQSAIPNLVQRHAVTKAYTQTQFSNKTNPQPNPNLRLYTNIQEKQAKPRNNITHYAYINANYLNNIQKKQLGS